MTTQKSVPKVTRDGQISEVLPAGTTAKKKIKVKSTPELVHYIDGSVKVKNIPLNNAEQLSPDLTKEQVYQVFKNVRRSKKTPKSGKSDRYADRRVKGTSDFIPYDVAMKTGLDLLWSGSHPAIGFYIVTAVNTGLRTGDIQKIKYSDLIDKKVGDVLIVNEQKTGKDRKIKINDKILEAFKYMLKYHLKQSRGTFKDAYIFRSQKGTTFRTVSLNRILKEVFRGVAPTVSTHSLRKSFGRHVYDMNHQSEHALIVLSKIFSHTNMQDTRRYLGLSDEEIGDVYLNL